MTIHVDPEKIICDLLAAETIGDIYRIPFPFLSGTLSHADCFSAFYDPKGEPNVSNDFTEQQLETEPSTKGHFHSSFVEAAKIVTNLQARVIARNAAKFGHPLYCRTSFEAFMSGRTIHGKSIHIDNAINPKAIIGIVCDMEGSLVTPHEAVYDILRGSVYRPLLDVRVGGLAPSGKDKEDRGVKLLSNFFRDLPDVRGCKVPAGHPVYQVSAQLREASIVIPPLTIGWMTGVSPHGQQKQVSPKRIFLASDNNYSFVPESSEAQMARFRYKRLRRAFLGLS